MKQTKAKPPLNAEDSWPIKKSLYKWAIHISFIIKYVRHCCVCWEYKRKVACTHELIFLQFAKKKSPQQKRERCKLHEQILFIASFVWSVSERQFVLRVTGKGIRRRDLCSKDIYRSKQMSFFSQRNNGGLPDSSLNLCEQKRLTKLELEVHVIQPLIKPFLLILH